MAAAHAPCLTSGWPRQGSACQHRGMDFLRFFASRVREKLWIKPLAVCLLSIVGALLAKLVDGLAVGSTLPGVSSSSVEDLLKLIAASMLVMATLAVGSMVAAYASAGAAATPRAFPLVVADDLSQNALSSFIGAFIFSVVAFTSLSNGFYGRGGRFVLFVGALAVLAFVLVTFVRWVDGIARLGRLGSVIEKVEAATLDALQARRAAPYLRGRAAGAPLPQSRPAYAARIGYVQYIDMAALQKCAETANACIQVEALPGTFAAPGRPLAWISDGSASEVHLEPAQVAECFLIGSDRKFDQDPRFGLVVLSEISSRALSPAVNDPGTAVQVIGVLLRLLAAWGAPDENAGKQSVLHDRVLVPALELSDMFDDAFAAIERDGAGTLEVGVRLQKALAALASLDHPAMRVEAREHARRALQRAEGKLDATDFAELEEAATLVAQAPSPGPIA